MLTFHCVVLFVGLWQLNIAFPATGAQKVIEIDDERKLRLFYDKRIGQEVAGEGELIVAEFLVLCVVCGCR